MLKKEYIEKHGTKGNLKDIMYFVKSAKEQRRQS